MPVKKKFNFQGDSFFWVFGLGNESMEEDHLNYRIYSIILSIWSMIVQCCHQDFMEDFLELNSLPDLLTGWSQSRSTPAMKTLLHILSRSLILVGYHGFGSRSPIPSPISPLAPLVSRLVPSPLFLEYSSSTQLLSLVPRSLFLSKTNPFKLQFEIE